MSSIAGGGIKELWLNPLTLDDVRQLLRQSGNEDHTEFIRQAYDHGLEAFLRNPQLLNVLWTVVSNGWPGSISEAFYMACKSLVKEHSKEHRDAMRGSVTVSDDEVFKAAGAISALLLLNCGEGCTDMHSDDPEILSLRDVEWDGNRAALNSALGSELFTGEAECRTPRHRTVAEYIGAAYLVSRIESIHGPGADRVLNLLLGLDGVPQPDLRGLAAWLAAFNKRVRSTLIKADPEGVAFLGDTSGFGKGDRNLLLEQLEHAVETMDFWPRGAALRALAGGRDLSEFWRVIESPNRSNARQHLVQLLISGLSSGPIEMPVRLGDRGRAALLQTVHDPTWNIDVRCMAALALSHGLADRPSRVSTLTGMIENVDQLQDERNQLLGTLLSRLYPEALPVETVWNYLDVAPAPEGHYQRFWRGLADQLNESQVRALLESLCQQGAEIIPKLAKHAINEIVVRLLQRGLELCGESLGVPALYRWFDLVEFDIANFCLVAAFLPGPKRRRHDAKAQDAIWAWLNKRPEIQRDLIVFGLQARSDDLGKESLELIIGAKFAGVRARGDFRQWCLNHAVELCSSHEKIAKELYLWAVGEHTVLKWGPALDDELVDDLVQFAPVRKRMYERRLQKAAEPVPQYRDLKPLNEQQQKELAEFWAHIEELRKGRCNPALLHDLACIYMRAIEKGNHPADKLAYRLYDETDLVVAAMEGLRSLLNSKDLPSLQQLADLEERGMMSYFAMPYLAGLEEYQRISHSALGQLDEAGIRRAVGSFLLSGFSVKRNERPGANGSADYHWYRSILKSSPELAADALVAIHNASVRAKQSPHAFMYELGRGEAYQDSFVLGFKRMLRVYPSRCTKRQLESLQLVIRAALSLKGQLPDLQSLVRRRLARKDMDVAQRAHWLCAGLIVDRNESLPQVREFLADGSDTRAWHVVDVLTRLGSGNCIRLEVDQWSSSEVATLIRSLSGRLRPFSGPDKARYLSFGEEARMYYGGLLTSWLDSLAKRPGVYAARALEELASDSSLRSWQVQTRRAKEAQARIRRIEHSKIPSIGEIQQVLRGGAPTSAADLLIAIINELEELANRIRDGNTNDILQYWDTTPGAASVNAPMHENLCRDRLISDLEAVVVQHGLDLQREASFSNDSRASFRVALESSLAIPIVVKKQTSRDIWRGIQEQLVPEYATAPEADGFGVYVVFWFGAEHEMIMPPQGRLPKTASELRSRLQDMLPPDLSCRIGIVVIDVSLTQMNIERSDREIHQADYLTTLAGV